MNVPVNFTVRCPHDCSFEEFEIPPSFANSAKFERVWFMFETWLILVSGYLKIPLRTYLVKGDEDCDNKCGKKQKESK